MIKNKFLFFDLDNTLCLVDQQIKPSTIRLLKKLSINNQIIICSGKTTFYLSGLVRQLTNTKDDFDDLILIGENGACVQIGGKIPSKAYHYTYQNTKDIIKLKEIEKHLLNKFNSLVFLQPNLQTVTFFVYDKKTIELIKQELETLEFKNYDVFIDTMSIDLMPKGMNKATGVRFIKDEYQINQTDCIGIGDNFNDIPMFKECDIDLVIGNKLDKVFEQKWIKFSNINQALKYLIHKK